MTGLRCNVLALILVSVAGCPGRSSSGAARPAGGPGSMTRTACDLLPEPGRTRASALLARTYSYECCDRTLAQCLLEEKRCLLVVRLAENVCRRVAAGQTDDGIFLALSLRTRMMQARYLEEEATFDLAGFPVAGEPDAPVTLVGYAAPRGLHCARMVPAVHSEVVTGRLRGKARLHVKPFPMKGNPHSKEAGLAFLAALELGRYWEFMLHAYARFDDFSLEAQPGWAEAVGLDRERFEEISRDPALVEALSAGKMEGLENGVESTPAYFIDGHHYTAEMQIDELVDVVEELYESSQGLIREP